MLRSLLGYLLLCASLSADVRLPSIVSDGMVLQRDVELKVWGWADPGEAVSVAFRKQQLATTADANGQWSVHLAPLTPGGPDTMEIKGDNEIVLRDILVGDVWLASGQSNMTHFLGRWQEAYADEIAAANFTTIRQFKVPTRAVLEGPQDDFPGLQWKTATPENILEFTVIGYFFAKQLHDRFDVPQGILFSAVGGTRIEAWTSAEGFKTFPEQLETITRNQDTAWVESVNAAAAADRAADGPRAETDRGLIGELTWFDPAYKPLNWKRIAVPGYWEDQGVRNLDGVVWYRREIDVPAALAGAQADLKLGRIRNADTVYLNGQEIGRTGYEYPQREYTVPAGLLRAGKNLLVVRVENGGGKGGFIPDKPYHLSARGQTIDLTGYWHYKVGDVRRPPSRSYKQGINAQSQPASLYNGMIAPFTNYAVRGMLWYQGESNAGNPTAYRELQPNLIADWRAHWGMGDLPFIIAQLPNFMDVDYLPVEQSNWALMREVQMDTALADPTVGIGVNIELGEWNDIHPGGKKTVGERLALQALPLAYGVTDEISSGPIFREQTIADGAIELHFDHVGDGLKITNGEPLAHFAIAGEDKQWVWADARITDPDTVTVSSEEVPEPRYVRYAWADNPDFANLGNSADLPAAPFRTDRE
ncbi:sialate O-acetylesterase [Actomonas aquatica]|uniref:Sialate O-acetylesterase n=1 Tax=Actomonas aquatica TaxID=2866162 RepID=A0ABZ1C6Q9_9BACT|nr:sialate O-acetylesterase [Opitutus sp. WL0086]WRQ87325.1 sialate O-acetylesterase [Opitutus sp. WL0086]